MVACQHIHVRPIYTEFDDMTVVVLATRAVLEALRLAVPVVRPVGIYQPQICHVDQGSRL